MPCIIYHVSYENELKGKFCLLWGAFADFSNARETNEGKQGEPLSGPHVVGGKNGRGRVRIQGWKGRIFDFLFHLGFVERHFF